MLTKTAGANERACTLGPHRTGKKPGISPGSERADLQTPLCVPLAVRFGDIQLISVVTYFLL